MSSDEDNSKSAGEEKNTSSDDDSMHDEGMFSSTNAEICQQDFLHGRIDIDSMLVVARDLMDLATGMSLSLTKNRIYKTVENKSIKR
uniref:Uncharacterized protein n=1 Tax=Trichogramma kaykai TaxID=54128 RepID=A0ABD2XL66_9HYME